MSVFTRLTTGPDGRPRADRTAADGAGARYLRAERELLDLVAGPGVVAVEQFCAEPATLRLACGGVAVDRLGTLRGPEIAGLLAATADVVGRLHRKGAAHRRIDASHLLVSPDGTPTLCGFGGATAAGTPADQAADVEALGRVLDQLVRAGTAGRRVRRSLLGIARRACDAEPARRPSARQLSLLIRRAVPDLDLPARPGPSPRATPPDVSVPHVETAPGPDPAAPSARVLSLVLLVGALVGLAGAREFWPRPASTSAGSEPPVNTLGDRARVDDSEPPDRVQPSANPASTDCPLPAPGGADTDGDGCDDPIGVVGRIVTIGPHRWRVGQGGDRIMVADTDCDSIAEIVALRPATGEVFVFDRWASERPTEVGPAGIVPGGRSLEPADSCGQVIVRGADRPTTWRAR